MKGYTLSYSRLELVYRQTVFYQKKALLYLRLAFLDLDALEIILHWNVNQRVCIPSEPVLPNMSQNTSIYYHLPEII